MEHMTIPQCRDALTEIARQYGISEILPIVEQMHRRPPVRKARAKMRSLTPELIDQIKAHAAAHPDANYTEIGARFYVNTGRVSEALAGFRE
jgi:hypothetical protein